MPKGFSVGTRGDPAGGLGRGRNFLAGLCHNPKPLEDSIRLALAAAARSATILSKETLMLDSIISAPGGSSCDGCAYCVDTCPYHAITLVEYMKRAPSKRRWK